MDLCIKDKEQFYQIHEYMIFDLLLISPYTALNTSFSFVKEEYLNFKMLFSAKGFIVPHPSKFSNFINQFFLIDWKKSVLLKITFSRLGLVTYIEYFVQNQA